MTRQRASNSCNRRRSPSFNNGYNGRMITGVLLFTFLLSTAPTDAAVGETKENIEQATAVEGKTAEIPCLVTSTDKVMLTLWYKDNTGMPIYSYDARSKATRSWVDLVLGSRATFVPDSTPPYLKLEDVKEEDGGVYTCRVDFKLSPTQRAKANLSVIIPPGSPTILEEDGTQVDAVIGPYDEGTFFKITCQVIGGQPPPQVTWWQGKDLLDGEIDSQTGNVYRNTLIVGPLTREHLNAFYVCQSINTDKIDPPSKAVSLDVNFRPLTVEVLGSGQPLTSGMQYEVTCRSTGARPPALITWWMDDKELTNATSHTENLGNVTLSTLTLVPDDSDGGKLLRCLAQSPVIDHQPIEDSWKLDIQYVPHVNLSLAEDTDMEDISEGDNVTFVCKVKANPTVSKISWYHRGIQIHPNVTGGIVITRHKLNLNDIQRQDAGFYTCVASNAIGDGESHPIVLNVKYVPVCSDTRKQVIGAAKHDQVQMECRVNASPGKVTFRWYFISTEELVNISQESFSVQDRTSLLNYKVNSETDYGNILCFASNELGDQSDACTFAVVPAGKPDALENCTITNQTTNTIFVDCLPGYDGGLEQQFVLQVFEFDGETRHMMLNITEMVEPSFTIEGLHPGTSYLLAMYAENIKGMSDQRTLHGFTLPSLPGQRNRISHPHIFPITPILGVLIGVVGALVLVAIVVVVVMKLRGDALRAKDPQDSSLKVPHPSLQHTKDPDDGPDVILCRTDPTYEDVDGIPQKLKHANIYETVPYDNKDSHSKNSESTEKDDVEYAELTFNNGKSKHKTGKKQGGSGANGAVRSSEDATIYATIDHARTAQQQQQQLKQLKQQQPQASKLGKQAARDVDSAALREPDEIPLMDGALESSV
nr:synaptogenesis protein syg-2-like [Procambarus clarkii]